jgi:hypothetical protein
MKFIAIITHSLMKITTLYQYYKEKLFAKVVKDAKLDGFCLEMFN